MGKPEFEFELTGAINEALSLKLLVRDIRANHDAVTDGREDRRLDYAVQLLNIAHDVMADIMDQRVKKRMGRTDL